MEKGELVGEKRHGLSSRLVFLNDLFAGPLPLHFKADTQAANAEREAGLDARLPLCPVVHIRTARAIDPAF